MPKLSKLFPSKYLASVDLNGKTVRVQMDKVVLEEVGQQKEWKPVLYFLRAKKAMILNVTNARMIESAYGDDTDHWHGKTVLLSTEKVAFQGKIVDGLRIHVPPKTPAVLEDEPENLLSEEPPLPEDEPEMLDEVGSVFD